MKPAKPITVLLAEDHTVVRQGLCALLQTDGYFQIVGDARTGREAVELARTLRPEVILMDIALPMLNGLEADPSIQSRRQGAHSLRAQRRHLCRADDRGGRRGFPGKANLGRDPDPGRPRSRGGQHFFSPTIARRRHLDSGWPRGRDGLAKPGVRKLTSRESEVLQLVAEGLANKQIAATLGISIKTVEKHRQHLMDKLNVHETAGLTRYAIAHGIIENSVQLTIV